MPDDIQIVKIQKLALLDDYIEQIDYDIGELESIASKLDKFSDSLNNSTNHNLSLNQSSTRRGLASRTRRLTGRSGHGPGNSGLDKTTYTTDLNQEEAVLIKYDILEENLHSLRQACESLNEQYVTWCESRDQANQSIQKFDQENLLKTSSEVSEAVRNGKLLLSSAQAKLPEETQDTPLIRHGYFRIHCIALWLHHAAHPGPYT